MSHQNYKCLVMTSVCRHFSRRCLTISVSITKEVPIKVPMSWNLNTREMPRKKMPSLLFDRYLPCEVTHSGSYSANFCHQKMNVIGTALDLAADLNLPPWSTFNEQCTEQQSVGSLFLQTFRNCKDRGIARSFHWNFTRWEWRQASSKWWPRWVRG